MSTDWDDPRKACMPCRGRGWIFVTDEAGRSQREVTCPYCKGRQNTWWVRRNRSKRVRHMRVAVLLVTMWLLYSLWPSGRYFPLHMALFAVVALCWFWFPILPRRRPHAPGFEVHHEVKTDKDGNVTVKSYNQEARYLAGFGAAVGLRNLWDQHEKKGS